MYIINTLIPFNLIIDTDMGILKLLRFKYRNDKYFYKGIVCGTDTCLQYTLINRKDPNPISIAHKYSETEHDIIDNYYNQFIEREYKDIIDLSCTTSLADVVKINELNKDKIVRITILCSNELEKNALEKRKINSFKTIISDPHDIDLSKYDCLYIKNISDLDKYKNVTGLSIYIANYGFNIVIDPEKPNPGLPIDVITKYSSDNELNIFTIYSLDPRKIPIL